MRVKRMDRLAFFMGHQPLVGTARRQGPAGVLHVTSRTGAGLRGSLQPRAPPPPSSVLRRAVLPSWQPPARPLPSDGSWWWRLACREFSRLWSAGSSSFHPSLPSSSSSSLPPQPRPGEDGAAGQEACGHTQDPHRGPLLSALPRASSTISLWQPDCHLGTLHLLLPHCRGLGWTDKPRARPCGLHVQLCPQTAGSPQRQETGE